MCTNFVTKRPHKKSRAGCKTCKAKKIKCDEAQPSCAFCTTRKLQCVYPTRPLRYDRSSSEDSHGLISSSHSTVSISDEDEDTSMSLELVKINPLPPVTMSSGTLSATELRLMYHWSTFTCNTIGVGDRMNNVLRFVLPELAFENEFLLNGLLAIAALDRQRLLPDAGHAQKETDFYRHKASSSFRKAVATVGADSPNYEAALVMSVLLVVLYSQNYNSEDGELTIVRWVVLYRGLFHIMMLREYQSISNTRVAALFTREPTELTATPMIPTILMDMLATVTPLDPDYVYIPYYCKILDALGMLYASLRQDGVGANLSIRVITWPTHGSEEFAKCARENRPRALVILAHYLAFVKLAKGIWWMEGISDREIKAISTIVGPKYATYIIVPLQAARMTDVKEITRLLLG